jgi:hypothetical protein
MLTKVVGYVYLTVAGAVIVGAVVYAVGLRPALVIVAVAVILTAMIVAGLRMVSA